VVFVHDHPLAVDFSQHRRQATPHIDDIEERLGDGK
jgi:hypothetical protein